MGSAAEREVTLDSAPFQATLTRPDNVEGSQFQDGAGAQSSKKSGHHLIGVLRGEGIGPVVVDIALELLAVITASGGPRFQFECGGPIGIESLSRCGIELNSEVVAFCESIFSRRGAILAGPGGGRFVYDLRRRFDLYFKLSPIRSCGALTSTGPVDVESPSDVDIMVVRENIGGVYQGSWQTEYSASAGRVESHSFSYSEHDVRRLLKQACLQAGRRRGSVTVVTKFGGVPGISDLWRSCAIEIAREVGVSPRFLDIDCAAYKLVKSPAEFDVIAAPNLFGDILGDLGGVLVGSRGLTYSGNFADNGAAVFQTNHGAAYDLVGKDLANPAGQILSLAFLLREHLGLVREANLIEEALVRVWKMGWRTADLMARGCRQVGTSRMGGLVLEALRQLADSLDSGVTKGSARRSENGHGAPAQGASRGQGTLLPAAVAEGSHYRTDTDAAAVIRHYSPRRPDVVLWDVPDCDPQTVARATAAARRAWGPWNEVEAEGRAAILLSWSAILENDPDAWAVQIAEEIGKPVGQARAELLRTAAMLRAVAARKGAAEPRRQGDRAVIYRRSHGCVALITPWNSPVYIPIGKVAPALLFGNSVVWKPAPAASALSIRLLETFAAAGGPPGVLNLVCGGHRAALSLISDAAVDAVSLTGAQSAGFAAQAICARRSIPFQGELGGNNAAIVWSDTDLPRAAALVAEGAFGMAGQRCTANRRVIVDVRCLPEFRDLIVNATARLPWGDPFEENTEVGPLISAEAAHRVAGAVNQAAAQGYEHLAPHREIQSATPCSEVETFYPPTIIICDDPESEIVQQETFGPVLVIQPARSWDDAMKLCNGVRQGLAAALFSPNEERRRQFLRGAKAGILKLDRSTTDAEIDLPFGGRRTSGAEPAEHGDSDVEFYTRVQAVYE
jgi:3-isopropylmalate dehydrogenase